MLQSMHVLYREAGASPLSVPLAFPCSADNHDHAEEQCLDAYPGADVLWVSNAFTVEAALDDYHLASLDHDMAFDYA